jgi:hypothetical protein
VLRAARRRARRPRRRRAAAGDARDRGDLLRHLEARRDPALDVGALRRRRHPHRLDDSQPRCSSPTPPTRRASTTGRHVVVLDDGLLAGADRVSTRRHRGRRPGAALLHVGHHRAWRRASSTPTATCSRTRSSSTATTSRTASASTAWASGPGPRASRRCSGRGASARCSASTSARAASTRTSSSTSSVRHEVTNVFTTPTAMRSMMAIEDAGTRYPQRFRRVCSAGEPLNPEAIRWFREQYGSRCSTTTG